MASFESKNTKSKTEKPNRKPQYQGKNRNINCQTAQLYLNEIFFFRGEGQENCMYFAKYESMIHTNQRTFLRDFCMK